MAKEIITTSEQLKLDKITIRDQNISSLDLMERASELLFQRIDLENVNNVIVIIGPGNNGGDGLVIARLLAENKLDISVVYVNSPLDGSEEQKVNFKRLPKNVNTIPYKEGVIEHLKADLVIDALFGVGLNRPLQGQYANLVEEVNNRKLKVISIDIPSGLMGDKEEFSQPIIKATKTLAIHSPKKSLLDVKAAEFIGKLIIVDIGLSPFSINAKEFWVNKEDVKAIFRKRPLAVHKHLLGSAFFVAGDSKMLGASLLASKACLKSGCGLLHVLTEDFTAFNQYLPEAMQASDMNVKANALAIGPGLGKSESAKEKLQSVINSDCNLVLDADAINLIEKSDLELLKNRTVLTPHRGEFRHLVGTNKNSDFELWKIQSEFSKKHKVTILLKGITTTISDETGNLYYLRFGHECLATAGSGDVLTGIVLSLLAQGYNCRESAILGCYLHGTSAHFALENESTESVIASDLIKNLGKTFKTLY